MSQAATSHVNTLAGLEITYGPFVWTVLVLGAIVSARAGGAHLSDAALIAAGAAMIYMGVGINTYPLIWIWTTGNTSTTVGVAAAFVIVASNSERQTGPAYCVWTVNLNLPISDLFDNNSCFSSLTAYHQFISDIDLACQLTFKHYNISIDCCRGCLATVIGAVVLCLKRTACSVAAAGEATGAAVCVCAQGN
jgi:hypothetical protein